MALTGNRFYVVNDKYEVDPTDPKGGLRVKEPANRATYLHPIISASRIDGVFTPEYCGRIKCNTAGIYTIKESDQHLKKKCVYMDHLVDKGVLFGPFPSYQEAEIARLKAIPKTALQIEQEKTLALQKELEELKGHKNK